MDPGSQYVNTALSDLGVAIWRTLHVARTSIVGSTVHVEAEQESTAEHQISDVITLPLLPHGQDELIYEDSDEAKDKSGSDCRCGIKSSNKKYINQTLATHVSYTWKYLLRVYSYSKAGYKRPRVFQHLYKFWHVYKVQVVAWWPLGDKPLPEPMVTIFNRCVSLASGAGVHVDDFF